MDEFLCDIDNLFVEQHLHIILFEYYFGFDSCKVYETDDCAYGIAHILAIKIKSNDILSFDCVRIEDNYILMFIGIGNGSSIKCEIDHTFGLIQKSYVEDNYMNILLLACRLSNVEIE